MAKHFRLEHEFSDISLEKFIAHLNDPKLNQMLESGLCFDERTLIEQKAEPTMMTWVFRVKKCGDLPSVVKKVIKSDALSWRETSRFVKKENCIYWEILPESSLLKFHGEGTWQLSANEQGCKRIIDGTVSVDIPLVGKVIEAFIVNELVKTYELEPLIQERFYKSV